MKPNLEYIIMRSTQQGVNFEFDDHYTDILEYTDDITDLLKYDIYEDNSNEIIEIIKNCLDNNEFYGIPNDNDYNTIIFIMNFSLYEKIITNSAHRNDVHIGIHLNDDTIDF